MPFYAKYPASGSNPSIGPNGSTAPTFSTEVGGIDAGTGHLVPISVDSVGNQNVNVVSSVLPTNAATASNQVTQIGIETGTETAVQSIDSKTPTLGQKVMAGSSPVVIASDQTPIPVTVPGSITANQGTPNNDANAWPIRITDGTHDALVTAAGAVKVDGSAVTQPVSAASLPLPTGASTEATLLAFSAKSAAGFVPNKFDETDITYVGATTDISTVVYKLLGSTVATLTLSYDGSNRLSSVVKT